MRTPRTNRAELLGGKNRHATHLVIGQAPTPAGRLNPRRDNGYADRCADLGRLIEPQPDGCWLWTGPPNANGYGPYRAVWDILRGTPIRRGQHLHHTCFTKLCCNPDHLEVVTAAEHAALHAEVRRTA